MLTHKTALLRAFALVAALIGSTVTSVAQTKIQLGYTMVADFGAAFTAKEEGFFAKHGLDVDLVLLTNGSTIPQALMSDSLQIGGPTPSVVLQAVDGGLDLVALAGGSVTDKSTARNIALVGRNGLTIKEPKDLVGKKVGVPGIGALLDVLFQQWLIQKGVNPKQVTIVELGFGAMNDALKAGNIDLVIVGGPVMQRITSTGTGTIVANYVEDIDPGQSQIAYTSTRAWAEKNPAAVKAFREALAEGAAFSAAHLDKARIHVAKYTKSTVENVSRAVFPVLRPVITEAQIAWWIEVMKRQNMLRTKIEPAKVVWR